MYTLTTVQWIIWVGGILVGMATFFTLIDDGMKGKPWKSMLAFLHFALLFLFAYCFIVAAGKGHFDPPDTHQYQLITDSVYVRIKP